jgi:hypothetical protein
MFRIPILSLALSLLISVSAVARTIDDFRNATPEDLALKSVPFAPGAPAVILDWAQRTDDVDSYSAEYMRIKVLTEEGKKYADVEIPYVPQWYDLRHVDARMTKPDGTIVPFSGKMYEKLVINARGIRVISKTFTFPDVQPGCILEYRYDLVAIDKRYVRNSRFSVNHELPIMRELLYLRPFEKNFTSFFIYRGLPEGKKPLRVGDHFELELTNIAPFEKEQFTPPEAELKAMVNFFYREGGTLDPEIFWSGEAKLWTKRIESFVGDSKYVAEQAKAAVAGAATPDAKLRKLYARAQQIRNLTYETAKSEAEQKNVKDNKNAEDVLHNGYGLSSEINRTFVALARAEGFEASAVRIGERDESFFAKQLPIGDQLNGEVAAVTVDGKQLFLDAGTPGAPYGIIAWYKSHVPGILVTRKNPASWIMTAEQTPAQAKLLRNATLHIEDGAVKGTMTITYNGQEALERRVKSHNDDDQAMRKALEGSVRKWFPDGAGVKMSKIEGMASIDDPVVADFEIDLSPLASFAGSRTLVPLSVFEASTKNPFAPTSRRYPIWFSYPWSEEDRVTLQLPDDYTVESMPHDATYDVSVAVYKTHYEVSGKFIHFTRKFEMRALFFDTDSYGALRSFFSRTTAADQEQLVLKKATKAASK